MRLSRLAFLLAIHFKDAKTEAFELEKEESDDDEDTAEEAGSSSTLDDGLTDAERSAKIMAKIKKGNKEEEGGYDASKRNPLFAGAETPCTWEIRDVGPQLSPVRPYDTEHSNSCRKADLDADAFSEDDADGDEIGAYAQKSAEGIMEDNNHDGEYPDMADWNDVEPNMAEFAAPEEDSDEENDVGIDAEDEGIDMTDRENLRVEVMRKTPQTAQQIATRVPIDDLLCDQRLGMVSTEIFEVEPTSEEEMASMRRIGRVKAERDLNLFRFG
eukprot:jgi/Phyca11/14110/fgenesh1_pg.PHYCAscaffold_6_\